MKKHLILHYLFIVTVCSFSGNVSVFGQGVAVNETGTSAAPSAMLDISSTTKGILVPRMSGAQRSLVSQPTEGLLVYDTDSHSFWFYSNGWNEIAGGGSLMLPYSGTASDAIATFGITNTHSGSVGAAIMGKKTNAGSGIPSPSSAGVWGDNSNGSGVVGTSSGYAGVYGLSSLLWGVYGQSDNGAYAGVHGTNSSYTGIGVMGEIENDGAAVYGRSSGDGGTAGLFKTISWDHSDTTLIASTNGTGVLSSFRIPNTVTTSPAVDIVHEGNGMGIKVRHNKIAGNANAVDILSKGTGIGLMSKSDNGTPGKFEITNANNSYPALFVNNGGFGTSLYVTSLQTGLTGPAIDVFSLGEGGGINVYTNKGKAGVFATGEATATEETMNVTTIAKKSAAQFIKNNISGVANDHDPAVQIDNNSLGDGLKINHTYAPSTRSALDIEYSGSQYGADIYSQSNGLSAKSNSAAGKAIRAQNLQGGIAIEALSAAPMAGNTGTVVVNNTGGGNGVNISVNGGDNAVGLRSYAYGLYSHGILGSASQNGAGVLAFGEDGNAIEASLGGANGGSGIAGNFHTNYAQNTSPCLLAAHYGLGTSLQVEGKNNVSGAPTMKIKSWNNAPFATFVASNDTERLVIEKTGNIITNGTITVKENKGIVRNTYSGQLRVESVEAVYDAPGSSINFGPMGTVWIDVNFNTAFAAPPSVYLANYMGGLNGDILNAVIMDVTNSGFTLKIQNLTANNIEVGDHSWKVVAMGVE